MDCMTVESQLLELAKCKRNDEVKVRCAATCVVVEWRSQGWLEGTVKQLEEWIRPHGQGLNDIGVKLR